MEVKYKINAINELDNITEYISKDKPNVSLNIYNIITEAINKLSVEYKAYPNLNKIFKNMLVYKNKFRVVYRINEYYQKVIVYAILHTKQDIKKHL